LLLEHQHATSDPGTTEIVRKAAAALAAGTPEEAETLARIAVGRDPAFVPARLALGRALEAQGRHSEAAAVYAAAARISPLSPGVRSSLRRVWIAPLAGFGIVYAIAILAFRELGRRFEQRTVLAGLLLLTTVLILWTLLLLQRRRRRFAALSAEDRRLLQTEGSAGIFEGQAIGRLLVVGAIVILLSGAAVVFAVGTKPSLGMKVGDCFTLGRETMIEQISAIPCELPHVTEVIAIVADPAPIDAPFPGTEALRAEADPLCKAAYAPYVGAPYVPSAKWWVSAMTPAEPYWAIGIRANWCTVVPVNGRQVTGSARGSGN
jgi:Septum formation/Tetratricopeptide repeat